MDIGKIVFAEILEHEAGRIYKFKLDNGSDYATRDKEVARTLFIEYSSQYGVSVEELMKDSTRVSLPIHKLEHKEEKIEKKEEKVEHKEETIVRERRTEKFKDTKKEKSNKLKITLSIVSATVILSVGACHLIKNNKYRNNRIKDGQELIQVVPNDDLNKNDTPFIENLNETTSSSKTIQDKLYDMTYNNISMTDEEFRQALYEINMMSFANIQEISSYINGSKLTGDAYYCNFESIFNPNSIDYQVIKYFGSLKSNIINSAYVDNSRNETKASIKDFYEGFIDFVIENGGYNVSNSDGNFVVRMDDLTPLAKNCLYSLMSGIVSVDYNYKKGNYTRSNIIDYINEEQEKIYIELKNKSVSR